MGCGNPPVLNPTEDGKNELSPAAKSEADDGGWTHSANSLGADLMPLPFVSLGHSHFPRHNIQEECRSYPPEYENEKNKLGGYMNLNFLTDSKTDANLLNNRNEMSEFHRASEISYPDVSKKGPCHAIDGNSTVAGDHFMNRAFSSNDHHKPEDHMNFIPPRHDTATGYPIKAHGAEAKITGTNWSQMSGNFSSSECGTSVLPLVDNFGVTENKNDMNIDSPQIVDGNFLTLGIGCGTEIRSNRSFSTREISSKLGDDVASRCNSSIVGQSPKNLSSVSQWTGRAANVQAKTGGLSSSAWNMADRMSTPDEGELTGNTSPRPNLNSFAGLQTPLANAQSNFSSRYDTSWFNLAPSSLPFQSTIVSQPQCVTPTPFVPEATRSTYFARQSVPQQQDYFRNSSMNFSSRSSRNYLPDRQRGSFICHAQLGKLIPVTQGRETQNNAGVRLPMIAQSVGNLNSLPEDTRTEVARIGSFPSSIRPLGYLRTSPNVSSVEAAGNTFFPERTGVQISNSGTFRSAAAPFPKRLGVQPNDFAAARAAKVAKLDARPQAPPIVPCPSLKKQATQISPMTRLSQRRNVFPQHVIHHSTPHERQNIPATPVHIPPAPLHMKWQGSDGPLEPTGHKCLLCKRDLSFTAEGAVYQPAAPPAVAVLPCGHTFHDDCLQKITPEDQSKNPPCIPCAIGEI